MQILNAFLTFSVNYVSILVPKGDYMKNNFLLIINKIIRTLLVVVLVIFLSSSTTVMETKVSNENENKNVNLSTMALKVIEHESNNLYSAKDTYTGDLTGYVYNCPLCNGTLACKSSYNIKDGTTTYPDKDYGNVKIVASSKNLSCGTIIRFDSSRISDSPVIAIVLDRGVLGNDIDFLSPSLDYALHSVGRSSITYDVLREGWELK